MDVISWLVLIFLHRLQWFREIGWYLGPKPWFEPPHPPPMLVAFQILFFDWMSISDKSTREMLGVARSNPLPPTAAPPLCTPLPPASLRIYSRLHNDGQEAISEPASNHFTAVFYFTSHRKMYSYRKLSVQTWTVAIMVVVSICMIGFLYIRLRTW